jgi:hypothetical protein
MTKSEVKIIISYLVPLSVTYVGGMLDNAYIIISGSLAILILAIITAITFHKGEQIEKNKTDNINNTSYTFYHK